ncbi:hypothetical protein M569_11337, partial [Genlisea aurea]
ARLDWRCPSPVLGFDFGGEEDGDDSIERVIAQWVGPKKRLPIFEEISSSSQVAC